MTEKKNILDFSLQELKQEVGRLGEKPFRGEQLFQWLFRGVDSYEEMTNLPKGFIRRLQEEYSLGGLQEVNRLTSSDGHTIKYLYLLPDNNIIECVAMEYHHGITLCLSTQIGCRMGCSFCASTTGGLVRNLTAGEMAAQVLAVNRDLLAHGKRPLGGLVLMGSGEPLDNYEQTLRFLRLIHEPKGLNMGYRSMTLSTCGLVPKMRTLAEEGIPVNLAISLHAPNDTIRRRIMPAASAYPIQEVVEAGRVYFERTGRRVTFEYALIQGVNDRLEDARELTHLLKGFPCHVNLIPLNEVEHTKQRRSNAEAIRQFMHILEHAGMNVTRRRELGLDIEGACGQLKAAYLNKGGKQGGT